MQWECFQEWKEDNNKDLCKVEKITSHNQVEIIVIISKKTKIITKITTIIIITSNSSSKIKDKDKDNKD